MARMAENRLSRARPACPQRSGMCMTSPWMAAMPSGRWKRRMALRVDQG